jgi:hypothetical protein
MSINNIKHLATKHGPQKPNCINMLRGVCKTWSGGEVPGAAIAVNGIPFHSPEMRNFRQVVDNIKRRQEAAGSGYLLFVMFFNSCSVESIHRPHLLETRAALSSA